MGRYVDLSQVVTASYYDEEHEEWRFRRRTIEDLLDDLCDSYTTTDAVPLNMTDGGVLIVTVDDLEPIKRVFLNQEETGKFVSLYVDGNASSQCDVCKHRHRDVVLDSHMRFACQKGGNGNG